MNWACQIATDPAWCYAINLSFQPAAIAMLPTTIGEVMGIGLGRGVAVSRGKWWNRAGSINWTFQIGTDPVRCQMLVDEVVALSLQQNVIRKVQEGVVFRNNHPFDTNYEVKCSIRINRQSQVLYHEVLLDGDCVGSGDWDWRSGAGSKGGWRAAVTKRIGDQRYDIVIDIGHWEQSLLHLNAPACWMIDGRIERHRLIASKWWRYCQCQPTILV